MNLAMLRQKRARSIHAILLDAAANGQLDYTDVLNKGAHDDPASMRPISALQREFDAHKQRESEPCGSNTTGPFVIKNGRLKTKRNRRDENEEDL